MQLPAFAILIAASVAAVPAFADKLPLPKAAFSADVVFESKGRESSGHINVDGLKERIDTKGANGTSSVKIIRRDMNRLYDLKPQRHLAVALRIAAAEAAGATGAPGVDIDSFYGIEATAQGNETIGGLQTTKYSIKVDGGPGLTVDAVVWATDDGIIVRAIGKTSIDGDNPPARMELKNIVRGPQDASLFELPQGMEVLSPDSDSDVPQAQSATPPPAAAQSTDAAPAQPPAAVPPAAPPASK